MPKLIPDFKMWFDVPDDPFKGRVRIRHLQDGEVSDVTSKAYDVQLSYAGEGLPPKREVRHDLSKDANLTLCEAVDAWENFFDLDGNDMECTAENIMEYAKQGWFRPFISDCREKVEVEFAKQQETATKNSKALPAGSQEPEGKAVMNAA